MAECLYHVVVAQAAGERAVTKMLGTGAWVIRPPHDRLPHLAALCTFEYGERDWMHWRAAESARQAMGTPTRVVWVEKAGQNVFVDNARAFAPVEQSPLPDF